MNEHTPRHSLDAGFDELPYAFVSASPHSGNGTRERALWCAVLEQALLDMQADGHARRHDRERARRFLLTDREHFPAVCEMAGVSATAVRKGVRMIDQGVLASLGLQQAQNSGNYPK